MLLKGETDGPTPRFLTPWVWGGPENMHSYWCCWGMVSTLSENHCFRCSFGDCWEGFCGAMRRLIHVQPFLLLQSQSSPLSLAVISLSFTSVYDWSLFFGLWSETYSNHWEAAIIDMLLLSTGTIPGHRISMCKMSNPQPDLMARHIDKCNLQKESEVWSFLIFQISQHYQI